ncbi:MAG: protein kinase, partial [Gemmatimonadales bacterium]
FLSEIKVTANLQHPHILPLFDSGETQGFLYYVMPYVEGESLRALLDRKKQLPIDRALEITKVVASALGHAHRHGIIHRDIKPENILLAEDGQPLVADFGIALAVSEAGGTRLTETGMSLGTPEYMSPEQATGDRQLEPASDIYSLGAVLYEMLVGDPPHMGNTAQAIIARIMTEKPTAIRTVRDTVPQHVEQAVMKALAKVPADRWQSAEEMLPLLEGLAATPSGGLTTTGTMPVRVVQPRSSRRVAVVVGVTVAIVVFGFLGWSSFRSAPPAIKVSNIRQVTRAPTLEYDPMISPDADEVVYTVGLTQARHLYVQDLAGGRAIPLTAHRPGAQGLARWTPDGRSIVFRERSSDGTKAAFMIPRLGGTATRLGIETIWAVHGDRIVYLRGQGDSIMVRPLSGGNETFVAFVPPEAHSLAWSPDGSMLAYVQGNSLYGGGDFGNAALSALWTVAVDGGDPVQVTDHPTALNISPTWLPDGRHLLFVSDRDGPPDVYVVRLDRSGRPRGEPVRVTSGLHPHTISVAADGSTAAYSQLSLRRNVWQLAIPASGSVSISLAQPVTVGSQNIEVARVSPDGQWLVFDANVRGNADIYLMPVAGGEPQQVTRDPADEFSPDLSPDGREIVYHSLKYGTRDLFLVPAVGGDPVRLTDDPSEDYHPRFSPDGLGIAFTRRVSSAEQNVYLMTREVAGGPWTAPRRISSAPHSWNPRWSPDGRHLVYHSCANGCTRLYVWAPEDQERLVLDA